MRSRALIYLLLFAPAALASPSPNTWARGLSTLSNLNPLAARDTFYTVYPTDPSNREELKKTEKFLRDTYGGEDVIQNRNSDGLVSWRIILKDGDTTDQLEGHEGLRMVEPEDRQKGFTPKRKSKRSELIRRDDPLYIALAKDPNNNEETKATREFLDTKISNPDRKITELKLGDQIKAWANIELNDVAKAEVEAYAGISGPLSRDEPARHDLVVRKRERPGFLENLHSGIGKRFNQLKRAVTWKKQEGAAKDLVLLSQPKDVTLDKLSDFVYEQNAGAGVRIYVIDLGVQLSVLYDENDSNSAEFPNTENRRVLQTEASVAAGQDPDTDDDDDPEGTESHGTLVASKALGQKYGVAKGATLISVKTINTMGDYLKALSLIQADIRATTEVGMRSVIVASTGGEKSTNHDEAREDPQGKLFLDYFEALFAEGVVIVFSAGNQANKGSPNIDNMPKVLEDADTPIINVGGSTYEGDRYVSSQAGPQLTVYAPGEDVESLTKDNGLPFASDGTSIAAPAVAGLIATYLGYEEKPWGADNSFANKKARVQAIKNFIKSEGSAWERKSGSGINIIWNGADKTAHQSVGANACGTGASKHKRQDCSQSPPPPPSNGPKCNDLNTNPTKFVKKDMIWNLVRDTFCKEASDQGKLDDGTNSVARTYNQGTPEEVNVAIDSPDAGFVPNTEKCQEFMTKLTDDCDYGNVDWKAGGELMDGEVKYRWSPTKERQSVKDIGKWAQCNNDYRVVYDGNIVWGAGWLGSDFGHALLEGLQSKGLAITGWDFKYEAVQGDSREWTAKFNTPIFAEERIESAVEGTAGGIDIECN